MFEHISCNLVRRCERAFFLVQVWNLSKVMYVEVVVIAAVVCHNTGGTKRRISINGGDRPLHGAVRMHQSQR